MQHGAPLFVESDLRNYAHQYLGAQGDPAQPKASPLFAGLTGLPSLLIQVGANELLLDDAVRLAGRAGADGVEVTLEIKRPAISDRDRRSVGFSAPTRQNPEPPAPMSVHLRRLLPWLPPKRPIP